MRPRPPQPPPLEQARQRLATAGDDVDLSALGLSEDELVELLPLLRAARSLDLSDNRLETLPAGISELPLLEHLILRRNNLRTVPPELGRLTTLDLTANPVATEVPDVPDAGGVVPDWADPEGAVVVHAVYFQYYVFDADDAMGDWPEIHDASGDGLLAPSASAIRVVSAVHTGHVHIQFRVAEHLPEPTGVAAATDLELPSGVLCLSGWQGGVVHSHDFGEPVRVRLLLEVTGRDGVVDFQEPGEVQRMTVVRVDRPRPRWRSEATDQIGENLRTVRDTARPWDAAREP